MPVGQEEIMDLQDLPIYGIKEEFLEAVRNHQVVILVGKPGSGKTIGGPIFLYLEGFGIILVIEPRRAATIEPAKYSATLCNSTLGDLVGYQIRFDKKFSTNSQILSLTDGIPIQPNCQLLKLAKTLFADEAHEGGINLEMFLGMAKLMLKKNPELKLVVSSATINAQEFSNFFGNAPIIEIPGKMFSVNNVWSECDYSFDQLDSMIGYFGQTIQNIYQNINGNILVFMPGENEIAQTIFHLENLGLKNVVILPAYAGMARSELEKIFLNYPGKIKIVISTNIGETSITIKDLRAIFDSGFIKEMRHNPKTGLYSLETIRHSQGGCLQREGRGGRTCDTVCYKGYTEEDFKNRPMFSEPEIIHSNLWSVQLKLMTLEIEKDIEFLNTPPKEAMKKAKKDLILLGALSENEELTKMGKEMAELPLEPDLARTLIAAKKYECIKEVTTIVSFLSAKSVFLRPKEWKEEADNAHEKFKQNANGDHVVFLKIWKTYKKSNYSEKWCEKNYFNYNSLEEIQKIREQLIALIEEKGIKITKAKSKIQILKAITVGLVGNLLEREKDKNTFKCLIQSNKKTIHVHPQSALSDSDVDDLPDNIVCHRILTTDSSRFFAHSCFPAETKLALEILEDFTRNETKFAIQSKPRKKTSKSKQRQLAQKELIRLSIEAGLIKLKLKIQKEHMYGENNDTQEQYDINFDNSTLPIKKNRHYYCKIENGIAYPKLLVEE